MKVEIPPLHPGQQEIMESEARFKVLACGRRWGKSRLAALMTLVSALDGKIAWWTAPSFPIASIGWRTIKNLARPIPGKHVKEADRRIEFPGGGSLQIKSADNPDSLRGEGLDLAVLDEAAFMRKEAWTEALRPALSDKKGAALFCSTPYGANWFYEIFRRGSDDGEVWKSWQFPTVSNPFIDEDEIEDAKASLPEQVFKQEYLANFLLEGNGVFRNYQECVMGGFEKPKPGSHYICCVDLARTVDFTVITVWDKMRQHMVYMDRFNQVDWRIQEQRIVSAAVRYNKAHIVVDATGVGDPVTQSLQRSGLNVQGIKITRHLKRIMVEALMIALEQQSITFPNEPEILHELGIYQAEQTATGVKYTAPAGQHDDIVMSMCMAANHFRNGMVQIRAL
jgi:hypothetical protein